MNRALKDALKRFIHWTFVTGQWLGFDLLPRHFYSEIPDIRRLRRTQTWRKRYSMTGVAGPVDEQLTFAREVVTPELRQRIARGDIHAAACGHNGAGGFGPVEADFLFAFVAAKKPGRIVQVGCGVSTAICLAAAAEADYRPRITCVEPYPNAFLKDRERAGEIALIARPVEELGYDFFAELGPGDLFFIDSTHTLGPAGEASRIILEMLPRLAPGVFVHFHDIWFPYDYVGGVLDEELFFWHESPLLHAYLVHNDRVRVKASLSMLHYDRRAELTELLPTYKPREDRDGVAVGPGHHPCSIYLQMT